MKENNYRIEYTEVFKIEIETVFRYITYELKNIIAAENLLQLADKLITERSKNPESYKSFKIKESSDYTWYRININNYSAFYTVKGNIMTMRRFIYSKRNIGNLL